MPTDAGDLSGTRQTAHRIGDWRFDVEGAALTRGDETRRLEDRAARTLALLCRRRGEVVTQNEIVAEVWNNRHISPNSVAVVMRDLRRALDDDARNPRHIATVNRRGYRLLAPDAPPVRRDTSLWTGDLAAVAVGLAMTAAALALRPFPPAPPTVVIERTLNATGDAAYDPLALALNELVRNDMSGAPGTRILDAGAAGRNPEALHLASRLILWDGRPTLSLTVTDPGSGAVVWSGMAQGPANRLAGNTLAQLDGLQEQLTPAEPA